MIDFILNELIYNFYIKNTLNLFIDLLLKNFNYLYLIKREKVDNAIIFTNIIVKRRYNNKYLTINIKKGFLIYLQLYYNYIILDVNSKLFN